jgi:hypothetical protein
VPQLALDAQSNGLLVDVRIWFSSVRRSQMFRLGLNVPPPIEATLIIDTGADTTMINDQHMRALGLEPISQTRVMTSTSQGLSVPCDVYDISLEIINRTGNPSWFIQPLAVLAKPLLNQATEGMVGRDVLSQGILVYDGPRNRFNLNYS